VRIEDTDRERLVGDATEKLLKTMQECGLSPDEGVYLGTDGNVQQRGDKGPYIQSERLTIYQSYAQQLIDGGHAYHCFCTQDDLTKMRAAQAAAHQLPKYDRRCLKLSADEVKARIDAGTPHVVRMKVPDGETKFTDQVRGEITFQHAEVDDQVLLKSDGFPTYHLAVVVDDHLMEITNVIRGEEWISSTPKHLLLYKAFSWETPMFAHLPLLLNSARAKLSKREGDVAVEDFLAKGYLPEALLNFVALLGWNPGTEEEIFSLDKLVQAFSIERINKAGAVVDMDRLNWFNGLHIRRIVSGRAEDPKAYAALLQRAQKFMSPGLTLDQQEKVLATEAERLKHLDELAEATTFIASLPNFAAAMLVFKKSDAERTRKGLKSAAKQLAELGEWSAVAIKAGLEFSQTEADLNPGDVFWPVRVALSGKESSPPPEALADILGKDETLARLQRAVAML
jgi:glutamyl-tRNA synthetase